MNSFLSNFTIDDWVLNAFIVAVAYLLLGASLQVRWRKLTRPVLHVLHPLALTLAAFAAVYPLQFSVSRQLKFLGHRDTVPSPLAEHLALTMGLWFVAGWFMFWTFLAFVHAAYRAGKYNLFAPGLHPALAPLVALALAVRALVVSAQGHATVLNLPPLPSRLVTVVPSLLAVAYFAYQATDTQRTLLHDQGSGLRRQLGRLRKQVSNGRRQPAVARLRTLWDFRRTQTGRLGLGLLTVTVGTLATIALGWT